jgi:drug/metabolite transporter superfamily protein YnfA
MTPSLVLAGCFVLFLASRRKGRARWVLAAPVALALAIGVFLWATDFYAAGGVLGAVR